MAPGALCRWDRSDILCAKAKNAVFEKVGRLRMLNDGLLCSKDPSDSQDWQSVVTESLRDDCLFCGLAREGRVLFANDYAFLIEDKHPVTLGHSLAIPKRHTSDYFAMTQSEREAVHALLQIRRQQLLDADHTIQGFNIGINAGEAAGQTIFHCHIHLIPRRPGDVADPRGGVRGVIPDRQSYP